jgi:hypothetical protein
VQGEAVVASAGWDVGAFTFYLGSQMTIKWLCLIFGITPMPCSRILKKNLCMTVKRMRFRPLVGIKFSDELQKAVCGDDKYPRTNDIERHRIHGRIGIGDGDDRQKNSAECILLWL